MKLLVVGGYGTFGGRLVDLLLDRENLTIIIAGRNLTAAQNFCWSREGKARLEPLAFDRAKPGAALADIAPDLVVDASGPFQAYGDAPYVLARACIAAGVNYIDLADGADFVSGMSDLDDAAKSKGLFLLSGMSSFPVLTCAASRFLAQQLDRVASIQAGIAPSPFARVGANVVRAIASYAGKPVAVLEDGNWTTRAGFFDSKVMQVHVPGTIPLAPTRFALAEVPDLKVLHWAFPDAQTIWMGAGPRPAALHRLLWACAGLVKHRVLPSLAWAAPVMNLVINSLRWGDHRGGFVLQMAGQKDGQSRHLSWHLLAEGDAGPMIPAMAAAAVVARLQAGLTFAPGARSGHDDLTLDDYQPWFQRFGIKTGMRDDDAEPAPVYSHVLGDAFARLDAPLQAFHQRRASFRMKGEARVDAPANPLAALLRLVFRLPGARSLVPVQVDITVSEKGELWQRRFGSHRMQSFQALGQGRNAGLVVESFGPLDFAMAVEERQGALHLHLRQWQAFGMPMPAFMLPRGEVFEHGRDGRFHFHVDIRLPLLGRVVCYEGWLLPT